MASTRGSIISFIAVVGSLLAGCAGVPVVPVAPPAQVRQSLAPTGTLRVGVYPGSPTSMIRDAASGETRGVTFELGRELARRLGVPFELVEYRRVAEVLDALKAGRVDFTFTNASPARAKEVDFTPTLLELELGYLVLPGSPVAMLADVDRPGIRVGVSEGSTSFATLSRQFKHASLATAPTLKSAAEMLTLRKVDAFATNKGILFEMSDGLPGARILDGRWGLEHMAIAVPKGREEGMAYLRRFADDVKAEGRVRSAVERAGLRGTVMAESR
jgi:polar amino acid transport system substrate-binding protein